MTRFIIVYSSWFGNTRKAAETIGKGISRNEENQVLVNEIKEVNLEDVLSYDVILIGSPNHIGGPTRTAKKLIDKLEQKGIEDKKGVFFQEINPLLQLINFLRICQKRRGDYI